MLHRRVQSTLPKLYKVVKVGDPSATANPAIADEGSPANSSVSGNHKNFSGDDHMMNRSATFVFAAVAGLIFSGAANAGVFGSLANFDVVNDTGTTAHGFEIDLEGIDKSHITRGFFAPVGVARAQIYLNSLHGVLRARAVICSAVRT